MSILNFRDPSTGELKRLLVPIKAITNITVNGDVSVNAPAYVIAEAERVASGFNSKTNDDMFKFVAISDMHEMGENDHSSQSIIDTYRKANLEAGQGAEIVAEKINPDCAVNFGDFAWGYNNTTTQDGAWAITSARCKSYLDNVPENFYTPGNHDALLYHATSYLDYDVLTGMTGTWRYKDFTEKKVRVIVLNTADNSVSKVKEYMSGTQLQWFCEALDLSSKSDAAQWGIIVLSHHPLDWSTTLMPAANILAAYENGNSYSLTRDGVSVSYDFNGKNAAKIIANFHGHVHCFKVGDISGTTIKRVAIPNACFGRNNEYGRGGNLTHGEETTYNKTENTGKSTAFCAVGIDLANGIIYADCYGAGYDRIISYAGGEVITYSVTNTLSNADTSNSASVIVGGAGYSATITAKAGYTLEGATVSVKMGGVDITSTAYSNGVISIAEVTDNVTISVVAVVDESVEVTKYTVTNNLSSVSSSNAETEIEEGAEYGTVLSIGNTYQMQNVTVTMGGVDITSNVYSGNLYGGNIVVSEVTGNIVVTASAFVPSYTNLVPSATATYNGTEIFNGTGYKNGAYVSDGSSFGQNASTVAVGFLHLPANGSIYVKGATLTTNSRVRLYVTTTNGSNWHNCQGSGLSLANETWANVAGTVVFDVETFGDDYYKITSKIASDFYYRVSLVGTGDYLIITHNEPIE